MYKQVIETHLQPITSSGRSEGALVGTLEYSGLFECSLQGRSGFAVSPDRILSETIVDAVGPEFMAPPVHLAA